MKVALIHDFLIKIGGAEKVLLSLSKLFPQAPIFTAFYNFRLDSYFPGREIFVSPLQESYQRIRSPKLLLTQFRRAFEELPLQGFDLVITNSHSFAKGIRPPEGTIHISYCHSPTRWLWDSYHSYLDALLLPQLAKWPLKSYLSQLRLWDFEAAQKVDYFIANSQNVARRVKKFYRRDSTVIYPPVEVEKIRLSPSRQDYFLVISRLSPYKNVRPVVELCSNRGLPLVVIGEGEEFAALKKIAGPNIKLLGFVEEEEKIRYLENARALIFPLEDDFGLVAVEAMAAGVPVIAFRGGGALETVVPFKTGVFFDELTLEGLEEGIESFFEHEKGFRPSEIRKHAEQFSEARFGREIREFVAALTTKAGVGD